MTSKRITSRQSMDRALRGVVSIFHIERDDRAWLNRGLDRLAHARAGSVGSRVPDRNGWRLQGGLGEDLVSGPDPGERPRALVPVAGEGV
jgi:hypothetical protein